MPGWMIGLQLFWNAWMIRLAILSSFVAQLLLVFLADVRRRKATGMETLVLWLAYQLANWAPTFALGKLSSIGGSTPSSQSVQLVTIWAALLMFHAGGPDNITSYSLEDNILSWRDMIGFFMQVLGTIYILYKNVFFSSGGTIVRVSSSVMFIMGIVKYGERAFALRRAKLEKMRSSSQKEAEQKKPIKLSNSIRNLRRIGRRKMDNNEQILLAAHDMLHITKGAFIDNMAYEHDVDKQEIVRPETWNENEMLYDVVDMELSLMYDILYTKAAMVHTWGGYAIRFSSHFITSAMFLLFWSQSKEGLQQPDVLITYIVLGGIVILDIKWLLRAVASTWTYSFLHDRPRSWLHHSLLCSGKWRMIRRSIVSLDPSRFFSKDHPTTSYRRWLGIIGQYNLFDECTRDITWKLKMWKSVLELVSLDDRWMEYRYHNSLGFHMLCYQSSDVRNLMFESIWECLKSAYPPIIPDKQPPMVPALELPEQVAAVLAEPQAAMHRELEEALDFAPAFQETILILHITTDIFLLISGEYASSLRHVRAIKALSNYMVFLVVVRPSMLPGLKLRSLYEGALKALNEIKGNQLQSSVNNSVEGKKNLAQLLIDKEKQPKPMRPMNISNWRPGYSTHKSRPELASALFDQNIILSDGTSFALALLSRVMKIPGEKSNITTPKTFSSESPGFDRYKRLKQLIPELKKWDKEDFSMSEMLEHIFMAWVRLLMFASVRCTRDSHAKQLACGGELTTILWILNEHAGVFRIDHRDGKKKKPEEFFSY
ncbi:uncharacterized protein [Oryza sativa Japonica Group]|uniref:OSJNBa0056L23.26 protein n=2 Tax=Oryza sativa subsp. japonica TaxID=39947 RepID=A3AQK6_ORYSJ|nr:uncharacterized protein LOC107276874 [Oryza sativa Japonica Group]XP_025880429.1 uncharacterized protein LOC107276874 [Oryza sativa Japonica Group]EAZ29595.1 hypothetical protein OsJ_13669 [Oryza sativa Japonica Group]BAS87757.1 Os04g0139400 [Oryza sativa Japonica Group]CAE05328.2 OSJNBa0056L23.26 [Oryza sativa Japonica Group]